jgi:hypothetical protein
VTPITALSGRIGILAAARILEWLARDDHTSVSFDVPAPGYGERTEVVIDRAAATLGGMPQKHDAAHSP